jgi:type I restriction enzyme S subunit
MEWKEYQIQDVCRLINGRAYSNDEMLEHGKYKIVRVGNLSGGNSTWFYSDLELPADKYCHNGDLLFAWACTFGPHIWKEDNTIFHYHIWKIVEDKDVVDRRFFYYYLKFATGGFLGALNGSVMVHITKSSMEKMIIRIPKKLEDQRRIASILSSLDRKIELNNKINADLEEMAQAIFKNWFVDFEPFKDGKFVDSELGMIPEGWKVVVFDNILKVTTTKTGKEGIPEYSVTNTGIHPRDEKFTKNLSKSSAKNKLIRKGNLVFGMSREILNWGIMKEEVGGVSSAYNVYIVDEKIVSTTYLECFIAQRMDYFADLIKPASREGQGVDKALLMKKIICIPPSEVLDVFLEKYNSIMHLTEIRNQENSRLSTLRDTLLPRLMSGELEVPE